MNKGACIARLGLVTGLAPPLPWPRTRPMGLRGNAIVRMPLPARGKCVSSHSSRLLRDTTIHAPIAQAVQWNMLVASMKSVGERPDAHFGLTESSFCEQHFSNEVLRPTYQDNWHYGHH